jgi:hypothetical protein
MSFYYNNVEEYALEGLEAACKARPLPDSVLKASLAPLRDALSSPNYYISASPSILQTCCAILWPIPQNSPFNQDPLIAYKELESEEQKRLIRAVAEFGLMNWELLEGLERVRPWNLPVNRDTCWRYVGLPEESLSKKTAIVVYDGGGLVPGSMKGVRHGMNVL